MRSRQEFEHVRELDAAGLSRSMIASRTGIPRFTIAGWLRDPPRRHLERASGACLLDAAAYSYLLGLYLGDGQLATFPRTWRLQVFLDSRYPGIIGDCVRAMRAVRPANRVTVHRRRPHNLVFVSCYSAEWPELLPQHGAGLKHERPIAPADWQREITRAHPEQLIRGLIHSDGCRFINRVRHPNKVYAYPRYMFSNRSRDIHAIFTEHLDQLGIAWRWSNGHTISIARREAVARLDGFVGPKR